MHVGACSLQESEPGNLHIVMGQPDACLIPQYLFRLFLLDSRLYRRAVNSEGDEEIHCTFEVENVPQSGATSPVLGRAANNLQVVIIGLK